MRKSFRAATVPAVILPAVLAGVTFALPTWPETMGLDFWSIPGLQRELDAQDREAARLAVYAESIKRRLQLKDAAINELVAGQIGLREAADLFLNTVRDSPESLGWLRIHFRGATDEERARRQVFHFVMARIGCDPRVTAELIDNLRREAGVEGDEVVGY